MSNYTLEGFRLSPQQKRLWLLQQNDFTYRTQCLVEIQGGLESTLLKSALQQVCDRHEILRTTFHRRPGLRVPIQVASETSDFAWQTLDWRDRPLEQQQIELKRLFEQEKKGVFDYEQGPLLRASLITLTDQHHSLLLSLPALCSDRWTLQNLLQELAQAYAAGQNRSPADSEEVVQYVQFSEWQHQILEEQEEDAELTDWLKKNTAAIAPISLPHAKRVNQEAAFAPEVVSYSVEGDRYQQLCELAAQHDTPIADLLLSAWQILIWRLTGQTDIVLGRLCEGRQYEELHGTFGLFAKYLPVHCQLSADQRFVDILKQVQAANQAAERWQDYLSWERLSETSDQADAFPEISFEYAQQPEWETVAGLSFQLGQQYVCSDRFILKLACLETNSKRNLSLDLHYDAQILDQPTVQRIARYFETLLTSLVQQSEQTIGQLEILTERDRYQLLVEFNQTQVDYPIECFHQRFEQQTRLTPDQIAVVWEDQQLTYAELNQRANQLAHYLRQQGVESETPVIVWMERSLDVVTGILAVLKAGGAYVPLDPSLPIERLAWLLQDTQSPILLTQTTLASRLSGQSIQTVCLDTEWERIAQESDRNLESSVSPEGLAYVIYTSGSTGQPKGVCVEHRHLSNYVNGILERLQLPIGGSYAIASTFAADLGHTVVFPCLATGGCLHILSPERGMNAAALADYLQNNPIDCLKIVPSHLEALMLTATAPTAVLPRKLLILGGEACSWTLVQQIRQHSLTCQIVNHYGPTETTVGVLTYTVHEIPEVPNAKTVPLGQPLPNVQAYVLDASLQPVPLGVAGELYIAGAQVTRGYLHQPQLTSDRFIPNPFVAELPGLSGSLTTANSAFSLLYRTGDLVRCQADGTLEFLGRTDDQVKIRGFRIELGEIEAALRQQPDLQQAVVVVREDQPGAQRLVAYVVPRPGSALTTSALRTVLATQLPDYMVPSAFVLLKNLPLLPNGKVDRQALPAPESVTSELAAMYVAPRTSVEEAIATIWADVLRLERVGIQDNFFELGGHSLLATQVMSRLRDTFQMEIPLRVLFDAPTVAGMAEHVESLLVDATDSQNLAEMLTELESLPEEELQALLATSD